MSPSFPRTVQHTNHRTMLLLVCAYIYTSLARITCAYPEFNPFVFGRCTCRPQYNPILKMTVVINDSIEKETPQPSNKIKILLYAPRFLLVSRGNFCVAICTYLPPFPNPYYCLFNEISYRFRTDLGFF